MKTTTCIHTSTSAARLLGVAAFGSAVFFCQSAQSVERAGLIADADRPRGRARAGPRPGAGPGGTAGGSPGER